MKKLILALLLIGVLYPQVSSQGSSDNIANTLVRRDASGDFDAGNIKGTTLESNSGTTINEFSIDGTLAGNSDDAVPTEKAVKTYADAIGAAGSDDQTIDVFTISGNDVQLSLEDDGEATKTVDISSTTAVSANTSLLNVTPGTATASKALVVDASKDIDLGTGDILTTDGTFAGTVQTEHLYSTDDAVIDDDLLVKGDFQLGDSIDDVQPTFSIVGDADSDAGNDVSETFSSTLVSNVTPSNAYWGFTSTQSAGYKFDRQVAIGTLSNPTTQVGLKLVRTLGAGNSVFMASLLIAESISLQSGDASFYGIQVAPVSTIVSAATGTKPIIASAYFAEPNISGADGTHIVTEAATVFIKDAPTEGGVNYALHVASGATRLDGNFTVTGVVKVSNSVFMTEQSADLASVAGQGQFWVKDDAPNIPMFTDDADTEWKIQVGTSGYGEMYLNANANATVIETADTPIALRQFTIGSLSNFTYTVGTTGAVTAYYDRGANVGVHDNTHGLTTGDVISIRGTTNYNGIFSVTVVDADSFYIADTWATDEGASDWDQGDYLTATNTGTYKLDWDISAAEGGAAGSTLTYAVYINATIENKSRIQRKFANNDVGAFGGHAILALSAGDIVFLTASSSGTNDMTHSYGALALEGI